MASSDAPTYKDLYSCSGGFRKPSLQDPYLYIRRTICHIPYTIYNVITIYYILYTILGSTNMQCVVRTLPGRFRAWRLQSEWTESHSICEMSHGLYPDLNVFKTRAFWALFRCFGPLCYILFGSKYLLAGTIIRLMSCPYKNAELHLPNPGKHAGSGADQCSNDELPCRKVTHHPPEPTVCHHPLVWDHS